jgi:hypothetical protein
MKNAGATYQTGQDTIVRAQFINNGVLPNTQDSNFRAVNNDWPVFALSHNLGTVGTASVQVVYSLGRSRDPAIKYIVAGELMAYSRRGSILIANRRCIPRSLALLLVKVCHHTRPHLRLPRRLFRHSLASERTRCTGSVRRWQDLGALRRDRRTLAPPGRRRNRPDHLEDG